MSPDERGDRDQCFGFVRTIRFENMRLPLPAASIITPIRLLPLTLRPLRVSDTSHWYCAANR